MAAKRKHVRNLLKDLEDSSNANSNDSRGQEGNVNEMSSKGKATPFSTQSFYLRSGRGHFRNDKTRSRSTISTTHKEESTISKETAKSTHKKRPRVKKSLENAHSPPRSKRQRVVPVRFRDPSTILQVNLPSTSNIAPPPTSPTQPGRPPTPPSQPGNAPAPPTQSPGTPTPPGQPGNVPAPPTQSPGTPTPPSQPGNAPAPPTQRLQRLHRACQAITTPTKPALPAYPLHVRFPNVTLITSTDTDGETNKTQQRDILPSPRAQVLLPAEIQIANTLDGEDGDSDIASLPPDRPDYSDEEDLFVEDALIHEGDEDVIIPMENWSQDKDVHNDLMNGWLGHDDDFLNAPFSGPEGGATLFDAQKPEDYFIKMMDERIWSVLAHETDRYARHKKTVQEHGQDPFEVVENENVPQHRRLMNWTTPSENEIKLLFGHLIIMGVVRKPTLEQYWSKDFLVTTPFFGKYMSRNRFQSLFWNLQVTDSTNNPAYGQPGHDPLCKVRPFLDMINRTFIQNYSPERDLSYDEGCCPFRGRLRFRVYNQSKPHKFHIKTFQVSEGRTGYILGIDVYSGKEHSKQHENAASAPNCTTTTKEVFDQLDQLGLLDKGHRVYMDNYYTSIELFDELYARNTYACGTVRTNRKGLPVVLSDKEHTKKMKPGDLIFRRKEHMLAVKWFDRKPVNMLSTCHPASVVHVEKRRFDGTQKVIPTLIRDYNKSMGGVDLAMLMVQNYNFLRKVMKWNTKLLLYLFHLALFNAYILYRHHGHGKMKQGEFRLHIAQYLLRNAVSTFEIEAPLEAVGDGGLQRLVGGLHYPEPIPPKANSKREKPSRRCHACNFTPAQVTKLGLGNHDKIPLKFTSFQCKSCKVALCVFPCFEIYHTKENYKKGLCQKRLDA